MQVSSLPLKLIQIDKNGRIHCSALKGRMRCTLFPIAAMPPIQKGIARPNATKLSMCPLSEAYPQSVTTAITTSTCVPIWVVTG